MFPFYGFSAGADPNLTNRSVDDSNTGTGPADAYVTFQATGGLYVQAFTGFTVADEWMTAPISAAEAQLYEVAAVKNSGTLQYGAAGTFQLGVAARRFGCSVDTNAGTKTANVTFTIRRIADGAVMATATMNFTASSTNA